MQSSDEKSLAEPPTFSDLNPSKDSQKPHYDLVLFIGVAPKRTDFTLETRAHPTGYNKPDIYDNVIGDDAFPTEGEDAAPKVLKSGYNVNEVARVWKEACGDIPVRPSMDAGRYLCEFIYYTGLWEYWRRGYRVGTGETGCFVPVLFLHVPGGVEESDIVRGGKVAVELIKAVLEVGDWERDREWEGDGGEGEEGAGEGKS
jgi:pyrrolidone-carboxylate peptidase